VIARRTFLAGTGSMLLASPAAAASRDPIVPTTLGRIRGRREGEVLAFLGIRYGTARRFEAPVAAAPSRATTERVEFGPSCPQRGSRYAPLSEDCLYLNVWTTEARVGRRRPVMVYFHGGAYSTGSVADPLNDGRHLARSEDLVVVTVNHRLNAFGYLHLAELDPAFRDSGNAGQLDLVLALQWVRDNIAAFGGDPGRVMLFGQSGGGAKIATLMGTRAAHGLFHRALTMSGQQVTVSGPINATARSRAYMAALGVTRPAGLLALPTERLVEGLGATDPILGGSLYFGPVLDMRWIDRHPFWPIANPLSNHIPMILGNTRDETRAFIDPESERIRTLDWDNLPERLAPELRMDLSPQWIVAQYREHFPDWSPERIFYAASTAGRSWPGQVIEADARAAAVTLTWVYQLDFQSPTQLRRGAPHTMDIALAFGTLDAPGSYTGTGPEARALSATIMKGFAQFARNGDPKAPGTRAWPIYELPERQTMVFDVESRTVPDPRKWERELFARVPYIQPGS
jgi:para-nitrobenzyl esterase